MDRAEGAGPDASDVSDVPLDAEPWGVPYLARPMSWDTKDCHNDFWGLADHAIWDTESRTTSTYATTPEAATVYIVAEADYDGDGVLGYGRCTGSVLEDSNGDSTRVLTAAHCVASDDTNTAVIAAGSVRVCTFGNESTYSGSVSCRVVDAVDATSAYFSGTHDINEDFAVLEVEGPEINVATNFALSSATSSTWDTKTIGWFIGVGVLLLPKQLRHLHLGDHRVEQHVGLVCAAHERTAGRPVQNLR